MNFSNSKKLEPESLSEILNKYQTLVENLSVGIYRNTPGPKGRFLEANSAMVEMFEASSKEEFMKHNVSDFYQDPKKRQEFVEEIMKKGEVRNKEINLVTLKGKKIVASVTAVMKKDSRGDIYFDGIIEDVTGHKKMEDELNEYRDMLEERVKKRTHELQELNQKLSGEITRREKTQHVLEKSNKELEKTKLGMLNVMEDLETAKSQLEIEKAKDEAMLDSIGEGLIAVDNMRKILVINNAAQKMLGWKKGEMIGHELTSLPLTDQDGNILPLEKRPTYQALTENKSVNDSYFFIRKDRTRLPISIVVTPVIFKGKTIGAIDTFRDITREKEMDRAKSEFVSLASHQLRTPLGIMKWYIEALKDVKYFKDAPTSIKDYFDEIYKSNERVLSLVRDLLAISRIDEGKVQDKPVPLDIAPVIREIVSGAKVIADKKKILLELKVTKKKIPEITIDKMRFREVIENLVINSVNYTGNNGKVTISIDVRKTGFVISVKDSGIGISKNELKMLYTKFFRGEKAIAANPEGSGLGLYVVKSYVEGWGGNIVVKSQEGKGSTFTISLPVPKTRKG